MLPSRVRACVLADHERLRTRMAQLRRLAHDWRRTGGELGPLLTAAHEFFDALEAHLTMEDERLIPVLRTIDSWGPERVRRMELEHTKQRADIERQRALLGPVGRHPPALLPSLEVFFCELEADMVEEERTNLAEDLLTATKVGFGG